MSTITKEWLQQKIAEIEATRDDIPFGLDEDDSNTLAALRIALAALTTEPTVVVIPTIWKHYGGGKVASLYEQAMDDAGVKWRDKEGK
ncbi:hypothetical protein TUM17564_39300 [Citrobacter freundii]|uniref:hypothetical protein n=1 Tax=Citrobacter freundii TaxID=546 RepID=UPI001E39BDF6|nr:hypothetical protein [Citrobacter freundii]GJK71903.1 hypothetical protein TUM17564_39300 [Citrobacter freundii]